MDDQFSSTSSPVQREPTGLARLHPGYSQIELEESCALLYEYFNLAWSIFVRLEQEGRLDEVLTGNVNSSNVSGPKVEPIN
jgi:hypothetical protein